MAQIDTSTGLDEGLAPEVDFKALKQRFVLLNQARLQRTREALHGRQEEFLDLLPLLFHVNHPLLPGYASRYTPCGVWGYEPGRKVLNLAKGLARSFAYKKPTKRQSPILALYFMGSSGTIAHAAGSDFDIWLCHAPGLDGEQRALLQQKAHGIEAWATTLGLELHCFLINPETFRQGGQSALSSESSGSAQQSLLLDEFYRTGVLLQGQYPLWWLVPPDYEAAYELYVAELQRKRFLYARDTIDFGGLAHIPAEEFFGAALWQLSKGIDAPYKAILKLLLIESYARDYPAVELLSKRFKQAVYDGMIDPEQLDPYTQMLQKVSDYLQQHGETQRLELARRCFYFKVDIRLSEPLPARRTGWQREKMLQLTQAWGWSRAELMLMDTRRQWRVQRVLAERQQLFQALATSYRFLSDFARKYSELSLISQEDLTTLGRKLYTAFERKAGKIDLITRGIEAELREAQVTLVEGGGAGEEEGWLLFSGVVSLDNLRTENPVKRSRGLIELLAWCHFNHITGATTSYVVHSAHSNLSSREVAGLAARIAHRFPLTLLQGATMAEYAQRANLLTCECYINSGVRLAERMLMSHNLAATGHTDPFHFGHQGESLVLAVDLLSINSWREADARRYSGPHALLDALCGYLKWYPPSAQQRPPLPGFYSGTTALGSAVAQRVEGLFGAVITQGYGDDASRNARYLVTIGGSHYCCYFEGDTPRYDVAQGLTGLYSYLAKPQPQFHTIEFDPRSLRESFLPTLYQRNRAGVVQLFFYPQGDSAELFVLDERGSLFHQSAPFYDEQTLLSQYSRLFEAVGNRLNFLLQEGGPEGSVHGVEFYRLSSDAIGRRMASSVAPHPYQSERSYFSLQVIVEQKAAGEALFTLYCDGKEFSTLEHGKGLFDTVVRHVLQLRSSGQHYPIYITDISLDRSVVGEENVGKLQTLHFLNYKRRIEAQLNRTMHTPV